MAVERKSLADIMAQQQQELDAEMGAAAAETGAPDGAPAGAEETAPPASAELARPAAKRPARKRHTSGEKRRAARRRQGAGPKFMQLERKETRLRDDQVDGLTVLARRLMRQRGGKGERITENTLVRVAVDVLLENSDLLSGDTEDDLAEAVTSELRKLRTSED